MSIELKGQKALDMAMGAMRGKATVEIFGLQYLVTAVRIEKVNFSDSVKGSVDLLCTAHHSTLK